MYIVTGYPFCLIMSHFDSVMFGDHIVVAHVSTQSASLCLVMEGRGREFLSDSSGEDSETLRRLQVFVISVIFPPAEPNRWPSL